MESRENRSSTDTAPSLQDSSSSSSSSSGSGSPSPPRRRKQSCSPPPPSPVTLADELCSLPLVSPVYEKVSAIHAKLCRVLPFFAIISAWLTGAATAVVRRVSQCCLVRILIVTMEKPLMWALGTARGEYRLRPEDLTQKLLRRLRKEVVRTSSTVARLPWRVTLTATGRTCHILEALKFDERQPCLGEVFIIGRLQQVYNRTLTGITMRLRTCHCALQGLQNREEDGTEDPNNCNKKSKRHDDNDGGLASDSSSDEDSDVNEHSQTDEGAEETRKIHPVAIKVTSYD